MSDLQRRLERLRTDLRALFTHMLDSVNESYHEQQARMLLVACAATQPLNLSAYSFLDVEVPDFPLSAPVVSLEPDVIIRRLKDMKSQVFARCKLLLEEEERSDDDLEDIYFQWHVTFLHRTVQDYLREGEVQTLLRSRLKTPFTAKSAICIALLAPSLKIYLSYARVFSFNRPKLLDFHLRRPTLILTAITNLTVSTNLTTMLPTKLYSAFQD